MVIKKTKEGYKCECGGIIDVEKPIKTLRGNYLQGKCRKCDHYKIFMLKEKPSPPP